MSTLLQPIGPTVKRGQSKQDYETPPDFMAAIDKRFGIPLWDLAATAENAKCKNFISPEEDSLSREWRSLCGLKWLNPPFDRIGPWAKKCAQLTTDWRHCGHRILFLTPASVGSNWFRDYVHKKALVLALNGRIQFVGTEDPYPKDCMLSCFGFQPDFDVWTWPL